MYAYVCIYLCVCVCTCMFISSFNHWSRFQVRKVHSLLFLHNSLFRRYSVVIPIVSFIYSLQLLLESLPISFNKVKYLCLLLFRCYKNVYGFFYVFYGVFFLKIPAVLVLFSAFDILSDLGMLHNLRIWFNILNLPINSSAIYLWACSVLLEIKLCAVCL
jgi:hypothetical protein